MASKPVRPPADNPERKLHTSKPKQTRVIARHLNRESNRKIAREEGIDLATVSRILNQEEVVDTVAKQQSRLLRLGDKAIAVYEEALDCDDLGMAAATATKILEGTGVMNKRGLQGMIDDAKARHSGTTKDILDSLGLEEFQWPPPEPPSRREPKKRTRRKPPQPEFLDTPLDASGSDQDGSQPT